MAVKRLNEHGPFFVQVSTECPPLYPFNNRIRLGIGTGSMNDENKAVAAAPSSGLYVRARPGLQLRDAKVARLKRKLYAQAQWLTEADDTIARRFCELQVLIEQVYAFIRATGVMSTTGEVKNAVEAHRRMTLAQNTLATQLGLSPAGRMAIKANGSRSAFDLPAAMIETVNEIGASRAADRAQRAQEVKADG